MNGCPAAKLHASQYIIAAVLLVLAVGLWRLQVPGGDGGIGCSPSRTGFGRSRCSRREARKIFDREGRIIVDNYPSGELPTWCGSQQKNLRSGYSNDRRRAANLPTEQYRRHCGGFASAPKYQPIPLQQDDTQDEQAFIEAHRNELPELENAAMSSGGCIHGDGFAAPPDGVCRRSEREQT